MPQHGTTSRAETSLRLTEHTWAPCCAGYTMAEVIGRNARFMQGPDSDPAAVAELRDAVQCGRPTVVELVNHRKNGSKFWNQARPRVRVQDSGGSGAHPAALHKACYISELCVWRDLKGSSICAHFISLWSATAFHGRICSANA